jgi:hypothetical protein
MTASPRKEVLPNATLANDPRIWKPPHERLHGFAHHDSRHKRSDAAVYPDAKPDMCGQWPVEVEAIRCLKLSWVPVGGNEHRKKKGILRDDGPSNDNVSLRPTQHARHGSVIPDKLIDGGFREIH